MPQYTLKSPLYFKGVYGGKNRDKNFAVNRNSIHQTHPMQLAKAKRIYKELMHEQIARLPLLGRVSIVFIVHRGDRRKADRGNATYETCKFLLDAIVKQGKLVDDTDVYYESALHKTGEICKGDPHVEVIIEDLVPRDELNKIMKNERVR